MGTVGTVPKITAAFGCSELRKSVEQCPESPMIDGERQVCTELFTEDYHVPIWELIPTGCRL